MSEGLMIKRRRLMFCIALTTIPIVATAITIPVVLLVPGSSASNVGTREDELRNFMARYPNTIELTGKEVAVKSEVFAGRGSLPDDFRLPELVNTIREGAFRHARLPRGFMVPLNVTSLDGTAFEDAVIDDDDWWDNYPVAAGSKIVTVENSWEYKLFESKYPGTLDKRALAYAAFKGRQDLPDNFALPSFLVRIRSGAFSSAKLPEKFNLPSGVRVIEERAFENDSMPAAFTLPKSTVDLGIEQGTEFYPFLGATFKMGFTIPPTVQRIFRGAFFRARLPLGFSIPSTVEIGSYVEGVWVSNPQQYLEGAVIAPENH